MFTSLTYVCLHQVKVNLAVLWEETPEDLQQAVQRLQRLLAIRQILEQVNLWIAADKMRQNKD
jgi:hypothetical protein